MALAANPDLVHEHLQRAKRVQDRAHSHRQRLATYCARVRSVVLVEDCIACSHFRVLGLDAKGAGSYVVCDF